MEFFDNRPFLEIKFKDRKWKLPLKKGSHFHEKKQQFQIDLTNTNVKKH
jgi:hypothetical protein